MWKQLPQHGAQHPALRVSWSVFEAILAAMRCFFASEVHLKLVFCSPAVSCNTYVVHFVTRTSHFEALLAPAWSEKLVEGSLHSHPAAEKQLTIFCSARAIESACMSVFNSVSFCMIASKQSLALHC